MSSDFDDRDGDEDMLVQDGAFAEEAAAELLRDLKADLDTGQSVLTLRSVVDGPEAPSERRFTTTEATAIKEVLKEQRVSLTETQDASPPTATAVRGINPGEITVSFGRVDRSLEGKKSVTLVLDPPDYPIVLFRGPLIIGSDVAQLRRALITGFRLYQREVRKIVQK